MITVNGRDVDWHEGMTAADALAAMGYDFAHITVTVDGRFVDPDDLDRCVLADRAEMKALHLHHGG